MGTGARIPMPIEPHLLTLAQWFSPSYPVGAFSYSHGLEWAVSAGDVSDAATLEQWLGDVLEHGSGRSDALFLAAAFNSDDPFEVDELARAFAPSRERLKETLQQGAAFAKITATIWASDAPAMTYPTAVGWAAQRAGLPLEPTSAYFLHAFVANLVAAGQRLAPIGQTEAQGIIHRLAEPCARIAQETVDGDLTRLSGTCFLADIASMKHETQYSRIFQT